jgi:hypothetical protein
MPNLCPVPDAGSRSAPRVTATLTCVVHDRQRAAGHEHSRGGDNQYGGLYCRLRYCGLPSLPVVKIYRASNESIVNGTKEPQGAVRARGSQVVSLNLGF